MSLKQQQAFNNKTICSQETICNAKTKLLKIVDSICSEYHLQYFAFSKLLISCVHYNDFIPDEADSEWEIGLIREDYQRLIDILCRTTFPSNVRFTDRTETDKPRMFALLEILEEVRHNDVYVAKLFHIRITPFDKLPQAYDTRICHLEKMVKLNNCYDKINRWRTFRPASQRLGKYLFCHLVYGMRSLDKQHDKIMLAAQEYNTDDSAVCVTRTAFRPSRIISLDQLFPLQRLPFRDMMLLCPNDYTVWTPKLDGAFEHQVKAIQSASLIILQKLDEICRQLKIGYFICGGTLLGCIRHGGFIPWDDDVDVAMLRKDYDRFLNEAVPLLDERFFLQTRESDPKIPYLYSKLRLNNTEYITSYVENRDFHKGIGLDIFPFDYIPDAPSEQKKFKERVLSLADKHALIARYQIKEPENEIPPRNLKEKWYHFTQKAKRQYYNHRSLKVSQTKYIKEVTRYNKDALKNGLSSVASFVPSYTYIKCDDLLPYQNAKFNGIDVMIPKNPDAFLTMQYGDYRQLPPKHLQVAHKLVRWSVDSLSKAATGPEI